MSKATAVNPLQQLANQQAIIRAENQYRLARLFTPYLFRPERVDYDRVAACLDAPRRAFPQPTEALNTSLSRIETNLASANALLDAFKAQGIEPTLDADQLFITAQNNVEGNAMNTRGYEAAA